MQIRSIAATAFAACALFAAPSAKANIIENCLNLLPCYTIILSTPDGSFIEDREISPVSSSQFGIDQFLMGSGSAFAVSGLGHLGAKTDATDTALPGSPLNVISADAEARFNDEFIWNGPPGKLRFTLDLQGSASATGDPMFNGAFVLAVLSINSSLLGGGPGALAELAAPGSTTGTLVMTPGDVLDLELSLESQVFLQEFGHGISDFADTFAIPRIELLDSAGNFVRDVTLTDLSGNVLGAPAPAAVPEPQSCILLGAGVTAMTFLSRVLSRKSVGNLRTRTATPVGRDLSRAEL